MMARLGYIRIQEILFELIKNYPNGINIIYFFDVYLDVIYINNYKNVELFCKYLIDVFVKSCGYVKTQQ